MAIVKMDRALMRGELAGLVNYLSAQTYTRVSLPGNQWGVVVPDSDLEWNLPFSGFPSNDVESILQEGVNSDLFSEVEQYPRYASMSVDTGEQDVPAYAEVLDIYIGPGEPGYDPENPQTRPRKWEEMPTPQIINGDLIVAVSQPTTQNPVPPSPNGSYFLDASIQVQLEQEPGITLLTSWELPTQEEPDLPTQDLFAKRRQQDKEVLSLLRRIGYGV